jgi:hypothetical protein
MQPLSLLRQLTQPLATILLSQAAVAEAVLALLITEQVAAGPVGSALGLVFP